MQLPVAGDGGVLKRLDDRGVGVVEVGVLADQGNLDLVIEPLRPEGQIPPPVQELSTGGTGAQVQSLAEDLNQSLLLQEKRHMIQCGAVMDSKDVAGRDVTEHGDLVLDRLLHGLCAPAHHEVGEETKTAKVPHAGLGRLGLLLSTNNGNKGNVHLKEGGKR